MRNLAIILPIPCINMLRQVEFLGMLPKVSHSNLWSPWIGWDCHTMIGLLYAQLTLKQGDYLNWVTRALKSRELSQTGGRRGRRWDSKHEKDLIYHSYARRWRQPLAKSQQGTGDLRPIAAKNWITWVKRMSLGEKLEHWRMWHASILISVGWDPKQRNLSCRPTRCT